MITPAVQDEVERLVNQHGFNVTESDLEKPWGGYLRLDEAQTSQFLKRYFPTVDPPTGDIRISPKYLVVEPHRRLSWQRHERRDERWRVVAGPVEVSTSRTDDQPPARTLKAGAELEIARGERHRLIGADNWGIVAEIWQHTDPDHPSDEDDIVRIQDDFERGNA